MERQRQIESWLAQLHPQRAVALAPASADASFRRYFRATFDNGASAIVMDAPPTREDCRPWLAVQRLFRAAGARVPEVLAEDLGRGFLLISDLGDSTYLTCLRATTPTEAARLYADATAALLRIQAASRPGALPDYDRALLKRELELFPEWYIGRHLAATLSAAQALVLDQAFEKILAVNLGEARVFVHRDYHSRNLMRLADDNPGIIDFQDAVCGPISYDLVSLFKDAYIAWDEELTLDWLIRYWEAAKRISLPVPADFADFHRNYEWMGVQRHLKVLGIFARLAHRDGKSAYLADMPLVARSLHQTCSRYRELGPLAKLIEDLEQPVRQIGYSF